MKIRRISLAFAMFTLVLFSNSFVRWDTASAGISDYKDMSVFIVDGGSVQKDVGGVNLTKSLIGMNASLRQDGLVMFLTLDDPYDILGPFNVSDQDFVATLDAIDHRLLVSGVSAQDALQEALAEVYGILGSERADSGSSVYFLTGGDRVNLPELNSSMEQLISLYNSRGWNINGINLSGSSEEVINYLNSLSSEANGNVFELSYPEGLQRIANSISRNVGNYPLDEIANRVLTEDEMMDNEVSVSPGTKETVIMVFRDNNTGFSTLLDPSGLETFLGNTDLSRVVETPHALMWKIVDPVPGTWHVNFQGIKGGVSVWVQSDNKYQPVLQPISSVPLGTAMSFLAFIEDESGIMVVQDNASISSTVTGPDGSKFILEMKDDGSQPDSKAYDGYYSAMLPPLRIAGDYQVDLKLAWKGLSGTISSNEILEVQAFPELNIVIHQLTDLEPDKKVKIATLSAHVNGQPYPVSKEQIEFVLASPSKNEGRIDLESRLLVGDGPAWDYDVYLTPNGHGFHTLMFTLEMEYAGRIFADSSEALLISTVPEVSASFSGVQSDGSQNTSFQDSIQSSVTDMGLQESEFPRMLLTVATLMVISVISVTAYLYTRTHPFGYLYNDREEPLVDFATVQRRFLARLLHRSSLRGNELNVPGLEDTVFKFSGKNIVVENTRSRATVRVNNQPLVKSMLIGDKTWIGSRGRLYTFLVTPLKFPGHLVGDG